MTRRRVKCVAAHAIDLADGRRLEPEQTTPRAVPVTAVERSLEAAGLLLVLPPRPRRPRG